MTTAINGRRLWTWLDIKPTTGTWGTGDICWNDCRTTIIEAGWRYNAAGVWVAIGHTEMGTTPAAEAGVVGQYRRNITPVVGQPKGWYCTVAGAAGAATWVSEGNL